MSPAEPATVRGLGAVPYTAAQARVITAALELFAEHGVGGTSLAMIADSLGVTKAAVYHQYRTKDEIVIAAAELDLARLEEALDAAEAQEGGPQARRRAARPAHRPRGRQPAHGAASSTTTR